MFGHCSDMFGHNSEQGMHAGRPHGRPVTTQNIFLATMMDDTTSGGLSGHGGVPWAYSRETGGCDCSDASEHSRSQELSPGGTKSFQNFMTLFLLDPMVMD